MIRFSESGFVHFYKSLIRFNCGMTVDEAGEFTYILSIANLDSCRYKNQNEVFWEMNRDVFYECLTNWQRQPYRTIVQLYRAMEALRANIATYALTKIPLMNAVLDLHELMDAIEIRFYNAFDMKIKDDRTIYRECVPSLVPREDEPGVCLMEDWLSIDSPYKYKKAAE